MVMLIHYALFIAVHVLGDQRRDGRVETRWLERPWTFTLCSLTGKVWEAPGRCKGPGWRLTSLDSRYRTVADALNCHANLLTGKMVMKMPCSLAEIEEDIVIQSS